MLYDPVYDGIIVNQGIDTTARGLWRSESKMTNITITANQAEQLEKAVNAFVDGQYNEDGSVAENAHWDSEVYTEEFQTGLKTDTESLVESIYEMELKEDQFELVSEVIQGHYGGSKAILEAVAKKITKATAGEEVEVEPVDPTVTEGAEEANAEAEVAAKAKADAAKKKKEPKTEKNCGRCKVVKPVADFYKNKKSSDGFSGWCKDCNKAHNKIKTAERRETREKAKAEKEALEAAAKEAEGEVEVEEVGDDDVVDVEVVDVDEVVDVAEVSTDEVEAEGEVTDELEQEVEQDA